MQLGTLLQQLPMASQIASTWLESTLPIQRLVTDSRDVQPGDLFIAVPGEKSDARDYIANALAQGAAAVLYEANGYSPICHGQCIAVSQLTLQVGFLASAFYGHPSRSLKVMGVTGTNGKTSCTHFLAQAFSALGEPCGVIGTLGNGFLAALQKTPFTTPEPIMLQADLARLVKEGAKRCAMEVSSHALDQGRVAGIQFETALYTQLSRDHLDYHGSMESYREAKALLFARKELQKAVINLDDAWGRELVARHIGQYAMVGYTLGDMMCDVPTIRVCDWERTSQTQRIWIMTPWGKGAFETTLLGRFNISNVLAVLGALCLEGISLSLACELISAMQPVAGRCQRVSQSNEPCVVVDYAHTPDALEKVLSTLREGGFRKVITVFGCGGDRDRGKRPLMAEVAERLSDAIIITDDNPRTELGETIVADILAGFHQLQQVSVERDRAKAIEQAIQMADEQDCVLIAGKGHETVQMIGTETFPFNDAEIARTILQKMSVANSMES